MFAPGQHRAQRRRSARIVAEEKLPERCACGGRMAYDRSLGRIWSWCEACTPTVNVYVD